MPERWGEKTVKVYYFVSRIKNDSLRLILTHTHATFARLFDDLLVEQACPGPQSVSKQATLQHHTEI